MERPCFYWLRFVSLLRKVLGAEERATVSLSNLSGLEGYHFPGALLAVWSYRESGVLTTFTINLSSAGQGRGVLSCSGFPFLNY